MILKSFHVRVFRNIVDSGPIEVVGSTCLVGKNEAGKSSTIEALHRLNPARPMPLVLLDDYPRWLKKQHEISDQIKDAVPISAVFQFSKEEFKSIETQFGEGVLSTNEIIAKRKYTGDMLIELPIDQARFIKLFRIRILIHHFEQRHLPRRLVMSYYKALIPSLLKSERLQRPRRKLNQRN